MSPFIWWIGVDGYQWMNSDDAVLSPDKMYKNKNGAWPDYHIDAIRHSFRTYEPLQHTGLFRTFAETPRTPVGMLAFANQYGHLGDKKAELGYSLEPPGDFETPEEEKAWWEEARRFARLFDPIDHWDSAIQKMKQCVNAWDRAQESQVAGREIEEVLATVNKELTGDRFRVAFIPEKKKATGYTMQTMPTNLLGALWVQFGQAVAENKQFRSCAACGKWYEIAPPFNRKSRDYCEDACRSRAYRERKDQALRMAASGKSVKKIAEVLESTVATVEGWLKQGKE